MPEKTTCIEGGLQLLEEKINARVVLFYRNTKDVFAFYTNPVTYASNYINEDKQKDNGVEADVNWHSDRITVAANYTYVKGKIYTKDFGKDTAYNNLYRRPAHTFNITIGYQVSKNIFVSTHFKTVSKFYEGQYAAAPFKIKGYYTLDFYSEYKLSAKCKLFADLQNITDQKYFDLRGFNSKRFNCNAGINLNL